MRTLCLIALGLCTLGTLPGPAQAGEVLLSTAKATGRSYGMKNTKNKKVPLTSYNAAFNRAVDKLYVTADLVRVNTPGAKKTEVAITKVKHFKLFGISRVKVEADIHVIGEEPKHAPIGFEMNHVPAEAKSPQ
jgi:hypothetical protein